MAAWEVLEGDCLAALRRVYAQRETHDEPVGYWAWAEPRLTEAIRCVKPGGFIAIWQTQRYLPHFWSWFGPQIHIFAAAKNFVQIKRNIEITYAWDPVVMWYKKGAKPLVAKEREVNRDWHVADTASIIGKSKPLHPCPRPLDAASYIVNAFVQEGGSILDPFAGSATIGVAAIRSGRRYLGMEAEPAYVVVSRARLQRALRQSSLAEVA